ncbi:MAG TPA: DUF4013 domain-containing protein [Thermoanaerobaculia bacterium]|jgi:hypothetical protein
MSDVQYTPPPPLPPVVPPPPPPAPPQFDFARPFSYVFDDPRWLQKILIGGLFYLAGFFIIGWFFVFGYVARTTRNLLADHPTPLPEWEDIGSFFNEGIRLVGVALCYGVPFVILVLMLVFPAIVMDSVNAGETVESMFGLFAGCLACLMIPIGLLWFLFLPASLLFTVVEQRFGAAFEFGRIWRFIRANVGNYLLALVVMIIARFIAGAGTGLLCIGVIFTGFWSLLISAHAFAQVYRLSSIK